METKYWRSLVVLALACFMAVPALSMPFERGISSCSVGMLLRTDGLTEEELNGMTLAEIRDLRQERIDELNNMTREEIRDLCQQRAEEMNNMTLAELKEQRSVMYLISTAGCPAAYGGCVWSGGHGRGGCGAWQGGMGTRPFVGSPDLLLLMDDMTEEEKNDMTLAEIREYWQQKAEELDGMTLGEIRELRQQKMEEMIEEMENTTLGELRGGWGSKGADRGRGPMDGRAGNSHPGFAGRW